MNSSGFPFPSRTSSLVLKEHSLPVVTLEVNWHFLLNASSPQDRFFVVNGFIPWYTLLVSSPIVQDYCRARYISIVVAFENCYKDVGVTQNLFLCNISNLTIGGWISRLWRYCLLWLISCDIQQFVIFLVWLPMLGALIPNFGCDTVYSCNCVSIDMGHLVTAVFVHTDKRWRALFQIHKSKWFVLMLPITFFSKIFAHAHANKAGMRAPKFQRLYLCHTRDLQSWVI